MSLKPSNRSRLSRRRLLAGCRLAAPLGLLGLAACHAPSPPPLTPPPRPTATEVSHVAVPTPAPPPLNFLRAKGASIVDVRGSEVALTGLNWFGMETSTLAPHGLWIRGYRDMLDQIVQA